MVTSATTDVIVIGAGISGLTTAICLAEAGFKVRLMAERPPSQTTSAAAGANWGPYMAKDDRLMGWSDLTRTALERIALREPAAGVRLVHGMEADTTPVSTPDWVIGLPDFAMCAKEDLPAGYVVGWWFTAPVVDMPRYLRYLQNRLAGFGTVLELGAVESLADVVSPDVIVVNCTGLGARSLAGDTDLHAVRGQLVVVANPGITRFFQDHREDEQITYFMPQGDQVVLGGCAQVHDERDTPDADLAADIIVRCAAIEPRLSDPTVLEQRVGLRPSRSQIRLEVELVAGQPVVHNYGHGGSGVTASWGCADAVLTHVLALRQGNAVIPLPRAALDSLDSV
jgi:D-amino-acid oxidase